MGSKTFTLKSGAVLVVNPAPFADASALFKAVLRSCKGSEIPAELAKVDFADLAKDPGSLADHSGVIGQLVNTVLGVATSDEVEAGLFQCAARAAYTPAEQKADLALKVAPALFDDEKFGEAAREDMFAIWARILEVNCLPFLRQTFSRLSERRATGSSGQKPS
ncbi:MAG: hypothetical protein NTY77_05650 [Elusimicrobia bacterium]|nr:hypothetical protein [Elusimicrobiota bacterium]